MNLIEFSKILQHPHQIEKKQFDELENITNEFPFFQAVQALYLHELKKQNNYRYNVFLKKTAAYTTDRSVLFNFITSKKIDFENFIPKKEQNVDHSNEVDIIDTEIDSTKEIESNTNNQNKVENYDTLINKPIKFNTNDSFSFNEWLKLTSIKPIEREIKEENIVKNNKSESNFDLIEKFIANKPKIKPTEDFENLNFASQSVTENNNLMTETLAHVYLEQKKYNKAITAFNILSLKYPEKSSFFANQIQEVKKIQQK